MAVRKDQVQISIAFLTDESKEYAKLVQQNKTFLQELAETKKQGGDLTQTIRKLAESGKSIAQIPLDKLAPAQLVERAKQLKSVLDLIPASAPEYKTLEAEYKALNTELAKLRANSKGVVDGMKQQGNSFGAIASLSARVGGVVGAVTAAFKGLKAGITGASELEQLTISFETFLGNAEKAKKVIADLREFSDVTPLETEQVNRAGRALLAFGFTTKELIPTLTTVGNVASGTGKDFNELALIYGKARAEGKIQNDTLNQLAEAGIPIYEELAKTLNVTQDQIRKLAEQGKINFPVLEQVFKNLTSEGGRFAGLMERQSKSVDGLFSTLVSNLRGRLVGAVSGLTGLIKDMTQGFINFLSVPVSQKLEEERQAFGGLTVGVLNANVGSKERTELIKRLQEQYPEYLKGIDAEKVTNEQLKPILDRINQSYIVRIALQKQQEKIQPLLEQEAEVATRLAEKRVQYNRNLARGAELSGVNLAAFKTEAEQVAAVTSALEAKVKSQGPRFFSATEEARVLNLVRSTANITGQINLQTNQQKKLNEAEKERQEITEQLRKSYGSLVDDVIGGNKKIETSTPGADADKKAIAAKLADDQSKATEARSKAALETALKETEAASLRREVVLENARLKGEVNEDQYQERVLLIQKQKYEEQLEVYRKFKKDQEVEGLKVENQLLETQSKIGQLQPERIKEQLKKSLTIVEETTLTRQSALEESRQKNEIDEDRYQEGLLAIQKRKYEEQLEVYRTFKLDQTKEARQAQRNLLLVESKISGNEDVKATNAKLADQDVGEQALQVALRDKFTAALITEQDYELKKLELKRLALDEEIAILKSATKPQVDEIQKREEDKAKVEEQIALKRLENEKRTEDLRRKVQEQGLQATSDLFGVAADLLAKDEAARKKNASTIKAFQSAQVIVQGVAEVQKIWAGAAELGPIVGPIIGAIQTAVAVGRTVSAVNKIQSAKFERGGPVPLAAPLISEPATDQGVKIRQISPLRRLVARAGFMGKPKTASTTGGHFEDGTKVNVGHHQALVVINKKNTPLLQRMSLAIEPMQRMLQQSGVFGGKPHSRGGTKGYFDNGHQIEVEQGEAWAVVNRTDTPLLRALSDVNSKDGNGVPFFEKGAMLRLAGGGLPTINTTPVFDSVPQSAASGGALSMDAFMKIIERFETAVDKMPNEVRSRVVYQDIEDKKVLIEKIRTDAAI